MRPRVPGLVSALAALLAPACTCSKPAPETAPADGGRRSDESSDAGGWGTATAEPLGLSAPIAAARVEGGDIVVAGLDVPAKAIRVQRIDAKDGVTVDTTVLSGLKWSSESDLKVSAAGKGAAITWRGLRDGKLVRQLVILGDTLAQGEAVDVAAASCATQDAIWFTDGKKAFARTWAGQASKSTLPTDADVSLVCGAHRAFAVLDEDEGASFVTLGGGGPTGDGGTAAADAGAARSDRKTRIFEEASFGEDDQRERAEYTVGDDLGVVRLATSGALTVREVRSGSLGPIRKLRTAIPRDADVVAVDASPRALVIVYTEDGTDVCAEAGASSSSTKVSAIRVDRSGDGEQTFALSPGTCGREVGPFFTGPIGDAVSVAWVERVPVLGLSRAPVAGIAHRAVPAQGAPAALVHLDQAADALVDAGCDATRCYAVALARKEGMDAMVPGVARVLRYP